ncbi:MAG: FliH/SctL family protein [Peptostreptococcaceae bacterium]|jgi:flagellar assembly protein FliH|nr:FliH/SctL family protein [Peptostreptococcaceae bacterium]
MNLLSRVIKSSRVNLDEEKYQVDINFDLFKEELNIKNKSKEKNSSIIKSNSEDKSSELDLEDDAIVKKEEEKRTLEEYYDLIRKKENLEKELEKTKEIIKFELQNKEVEAKKIIENAYKEVEEIKITEKENAYKEAYSQAYNDTLKEYNYIINEALETKNEVVAWKKEQISSLEKNLVDLLINSIEKIIGIKLEEDDNLVLNLLKEGLQKFAFTEKLIIRVNEQDYEILEMNKNRILALSDHIDELELKVDKSLKKNELLIDTNSGTINPSLTVQLEILKEEFYKLLQSE